MGYNYKSQDKIFLKHTTKATNEVMAPLENDLVGQAKHDCSGHLKHQNLSRKFK